MKKKHPFFVDCLEIRPAMTSKILAGIFLLAMLYPTGKTQAGENTLMPCSQVREKKTLTRVEDYVVMHGGNFRKTLKKKIDDLSLLAVVNGEIKPISFQIDEINEDDEWVLTGIPKHLEDRGIKPEVDDDNGHFDKNDELVFMARDSGDRLPKHIYPPGAMALDEIELTDPIDGGKSWVYLAAFPGNTPRTEYDYVDYTLPLGRVISDNYELGFNPNMASGPNFARLHLGPDDIIDRLKIRMQAKIIGITFSLDENNFHSELSLYEDGQIRVIRRVSNAIQLTKIFRTPSAAIENIYYGNICIIPVRIKVPISPRFFKSMIGYIRVRGGADFTNLHGWKIRTDTDPRWFTIDGRMDEEEKTINGKNSSWYLLSGPRGALLFRMVLNRKPDGSPQNLPIETDFFYVDDDNTPDPPEEIPGQSPNTGFLLNGIENLSRGTFYFYVVMYMIKDYREGMEQEYFKILDYPIRTVVK